MSLYALSLAFPSLIVPATDPYVPATRDGEACRLCYRLAYIKQTSSSENALCVGMASRAFDLVQILKRQIIALFTMLKKKTFPSTEWAQFHRAV